MHTSISFHLTPPDVILLPQIRQILAENTALESREKLPWLWAITDWLNGPATLRSQRKHSHPLRTVLGILLLLAGLILLLPALQAPAAIPAALPMGILGWVLGVWTLWQSQRTVLSVLSLLIGAVLTLGAALDFSALGMFLVPGVVSLAVGLLTPLLARRPRTDRYSHAAVQLLNQLQQVLPAQVTFTPEQLVLPDGTVVPYSQLRRVLESADLLALIWQEKVLLVQKKDLAEGDYAALWDLFNALVPVYFL